MFVIFTVEVMAIMMAIMLFNMIFRSSPFSRLNFALWVGLGFAFWASGCLGGPYGPGRQGTRLLSAIVLVCM